jgi:E3 ubiquitin-protein ligase RNF14
VTICNQDTMDDERAIELECISAIYPEIILDTDNPFDATLELPVHPEKAVTVSFPATTLPTPPPSDNEDGNAVADAGINFESHTLTYLPSLHLHIILPEGYPADQPPKFELSTFPEWLPRARLDELQASGEQMWEDHGRAEIVYGFIDSLQQAAENAFGCGEGQAWEVPQEYMISLLDFDMKAKQAAFEKQTFNCPTCLGTIIFPIRGYS